MLIEDGSSQKRRIIYADLLHELEVEFGFLLLRGTLQHLMRKIPGCKTVLRVQQGASHMMNNEKEIDEYCHKFDLLTTRALDVIMYRLVDKSLRQLNLRVKT
jgi:hypothetical protein